MAGFRSPAVGTAQRSSFVLLSHLVNKIYLPSDDQSLGAFCRFVGGSWPLTINSRVSPIPLAGFSYISPNSPIADSKMIRVPSGDQTGLALDRPSKVRRDIVFREKSRTQISSPDCGSAVVKATLFPSGESRIAYEPTPPLSIEFSNLPWRSNQISCEGASHAFECVKTPFSDAEILAESAGSMAKPSEMTIGSPVR